LHPRQQSFARGTKVTYPDPSPKAISGRSSGQKGSVEQYK